MQLITVLFPQRTTEKLRLSGTQTVGLIDCGKTVLLLIALSTKPDLPWDCRGRTWSPFPVLATPGRGICWRLRRGSSLALSTTIKCSDNLATSGKPTPRQRPNPRPEDPRQGLLQEEKHHEGAIRGDKGGSSLHPYHQEPGESFNSLLEVHSDPHERQTDSTVG
nr:uncharacterized protein LOC113816289 [Penaeus vannamei]